MNFIQDIINVIMGQALFMRNWKNTPESIPWCENHNLGLIIKKTKEKNVDFCKSTQAIHTHHSHTLQVPGHDCVGGQSLEQKYCLSSGKGPTAPLLPEET